MTVAPQTLPRCRSGPRHATAPHSKLCGLVAMCALCAAWPLSAAAQTSGPQAATSSQQPSVTAQVSSAAVQVAEPFWLEVTVQAPAGSRVTFQAAPQALAPFDIVAAQHTDDIPPQPPATLRTWTRRWQLESLLAEELQVPELEIRVLVPSHAEPVLLRTAPIDVQVASVLEDRGDPRQFRDIESVVDVPVAAPAAARWPWWAAGAITIFAVAAGLLLVRRRPTLTPAQWALRQVEQLHTTYRSAAIDSDATLRDLSEILHHYLQTESDLQTESSTSPPAATLEARIDAAEDRGEIAPAFAAQVRDVWALADKAKFAGWQLSDEQLDNVIEQTRCWLRFQAERA